jgi:GH25 family lysozyme M1 (1,4-beta-N-acetylmuramidase)
MVAQFVDVSAFQAETLDWSAYRVWASQGGSLARVAIRSSFGVGYLDQHFQAYRAGALAAGVDSILYYHYAYPQFNSASAEADWQHRIVGTVRPQDQLVLDFEENVNEATAEWAYQFLARQEQNYGKLPVIYASDYYIRQRLQDARLAKYPLWLANWQYSSDARPACPPPWKVYTYLQYTDKAVSIPGIAGTVDANIYLGGNTMQIPQGWKDDGTTLTAPNTIPVIKGFRDFILAHPWDPNNYPLAREEGRNPVEVSNPSLGPGTQQLFRLFPLEWTQDRGVFPAWGGQEILALRALVASLQGENTRLAQQLATQNSDLVARLQQIHSLSSIS